MWTRQIRLAASWRNWETPARLHSPSRNGLTRMSCQALAVVLLFTACGCAAPGVAQVAAPQPLTNPIFVSSTNEELVWERAVDVIHDFQFEIGQENRLARIIQTRPKIGASVMEPWQPDSIGLANQLESTLQSVRRTVQISMQPSDQQPGYLVSVAVYKEIEDLPGIAANSPGAATFSEENDPLMRDLDAVVGQSSPSRWIRVGRDPALEEAILRQLMAVYSL